MWKTVLWTDQPVAECPPNGDNFSALPYSRVMQYFKLFWGLQYKLLNTIYNGHLVISSYHHRMHTQTVNTLTCWQRQLKTISEHRKEKGNELWRKDRKDQVTVTLPSQAI